MGKPSPWVNQAPWLPLTCTEASGCGWRKTQNHVVSCHSPYVILIFSMPLRPPAIFCSALAHSTKLLFCAFSFSKPQLSLSHPHSWHITLLPILLKFRSKRKRTFLCPQSTCLQLRGNTLTFLLPISGSMLSWFFCFHPASFFFVSFALFLLIFQISKLWRVPKVLSSVLISIHIHLRGYLIQYCGFKNHLCL